MSAAPMKPGADAILRDARAEPARIDAALAHVEA
jgi:hypothetical protein